jgi:hypothetical protein
VSPKGVLVPVSVDQVVDPKPPSDGEESDEVDRKVPENPKDLESVDNDFGFDEDDELGKVEGEEEEEKDDDEDEDEDDEEAEPEGDDDAVDRDLDDGRGEKADEP